MKRLSADDSAGSRVKVGHCQATIEKALVQVEGLFLCALSMGALLEVRGKRPATAS